MTAQNLALKHPYTSNGSQTVFDYDNYIWDKSHLRLAVFNAAGVAQPDLVVDVDYTVQNVGVAGGGTITLTTALTSGWKLVILYNYPVEQTFDLTNTIRVFTADHETALDKIVYGMLTLKEQLARAVLVPEDGSVTSTEYLQDVQANRTAAEAAQALAESARDDAEAAWDSISPISAAIATVAGISSAVSTVAGIQAAVSTVAGIQAAVSTVATSNASVVAVAGSIANVNTVAANISSVIDAANNIPKANLSATTDPGVGDDAADGYQAGSLWVNVTLNKVFVCADATNGAAVWNNVSGGVTDGDKGDVVVSSSGTVWTLDTVTVAKGGTGATDAATAFSNLKQAATTSATGVVELATTAETTARTDTSRAVTPESLQGLMGGGTNVSLSGTSTVLSTSIPSWAKKVTVILNNVSLSGTSVPKIQLGTSVSYVNSGYTSYACAAAPVNPYAFVTSSTSGFALSAGNATIAQFVKCEFTLLTGNTWVWSACGGINNGSLTFGVSAGGSISLGGVLTRAQILTDNGSDTFDSGSATLFWE